MRDRRSNSEIRKTLVESHRCFAATNKKSSTPDASQIAEYFVAHIEKYWRKNLAFAVALDLLKTESSNCFSSFDDSVGID